MRTALLLLGLTLALILPAAAADISGTWSFEVDTPAGAGTPTFTFKQDGNKLTGTYSGAAGEAPLTGTVSGTKVEFSFKASLGADEVTVTYTGTIENASRMTGTAVYPGVGNATWTAKKN